MKKSFCLIFAFVLLLINTGVVIAKDNIKLSPKVKKIVKYAKNNNIAQSVELYRTFSPKEASEFALYLEKNPGELPPLYFVMTADHVYDTDKDKAVFMYNFGKVRAMEDVKMCKDTSAKQQTMFYGLMAPKTLKYMQSKATDIEYVSSLYNKIIEWDNLYDDRVSPAWACFHGIQAFSSRPELLPDSEFERIKNEMHESLKNVPQIIKDAAEEQQETNQ